MTEHKEAKCVKHEWKRLGVLNSRIYFLDNDEYVTIMKCECICPKCLVKRVIEICE